MSQAAVDSRPSGRGIVGSDFERAKERIARRRRAKDGDGSSDGDVCPSVEDAAPNTSSHARGNSSDEDTSSGATARRRCCNVCAMTEAPAWAVHNRYIHSGYRTGGGYYGALRSVRLRARAPDPSSSLNPVDVNYSLFPSSPSVGPPTVDPPPAPPLPLPIPAGVPATQRDVQHMDAPRRPRHLHRDNHLDGVRLGPVSTAAAARYMDLW